MVVLVRKVSIRWWSLSRWVISPTFLLSKKLIGNFISLIRKCEMMLRLILVLICSRIQLRIMSTLTRPKKHELRDEDKVNEVDIVLMDPVINETLGEKRKNQAYNTSKHHSQTYLHQVFLVRSQVLKQKAETRVWFPVTLVSI
jgi:hypothetical protein